MHLNNTHAFGHCVISRGQYGLQHPRSEGDHRPMPVQHQLNKFWLKFQHAPNACSLYLHIFFVPTLICLNALYTLVNVTVPFKVI